MLSTHEIIDKNFESIISILEDYIKNPETPDILFKRDLRGVLFKLEGVLRIHLKTKQFKNSEDVRLAEESLLKLKELEDNLGKYSLYNEINDYCRKNKLTEVDPLYSKTMLFEYIEEHWINIGLKKPNSKIYKTKNSINLTKILELQLKLKKIKFPKLSNKLLRKMISLEVKRINKKSLKLKKYILKPQNSLKNLELGFHEWRRGIRWISIYMQFYKNQFYLKPSKNPSKNVKKLYEKHKDNSFTFFENKNGVKVNKTKFLELSDYIQKVGEIKERAEIQIFKKLKNVYSVKESHDIYKSFIKHNPLKNIIISN